MKLIASCHLTKELVRFNGIKSSNHLLTEDNWMKELYTQLNLDYPKFHKMDNLAKMAFLSTELMQKETDFSCYDENDLALLFSNRGASNTTDQKYTSSFIEKGSPSPSLFVYTLPNILTGELSIRNKWYGENIFFIQEKFNAGFYIEQINFYLSKGNKACLCGWVESFNGTEECFLFLVEASGEENKLTIAELTKLYTSK